MKSTIKAIFFILLCWGLQPIFAQSGSYTVKGKLVDNADRQALDAANIVIVKDRDSVYVAGTISDPKGAFEIGKIPPGSYRLIVSYLGYKNVSRPLQISGNDVSVGEIELQKQDLQLQEVVVAAKFNPIIVKKDTIEFNTSAYKVQESAVVEDLLKKLPGVEVDQSGNVTAGGQQITKVFVDGKQFFGDDPLVATRNLPANIIDKVQVVDRKSDQAQFTGIEDDNTEKVINLTLRPGNQNGMFGRAMAGYGTDDRYDANGLISYFKGDTQLAALFSSNNTNNLNFSDFMGDVMSSMGGGGRRVTTGGGAGGGRGGGMGMGMGGGFNIGGTSYNTNRGGLSTTTSGGANVNYSFGQKLKVGGNYFFNIVDREVDQKSKRENILPDSTFYYEQLQNQNTNAQNHRINLEFDYTINEHNSILFRPNLNVGSGSSNSDYEYWTYTPSGIRLNDGKTMSNTSNNSLSTSGTLLWRHQFNKPGRTLSTNITYGYTDNTVDGTNLQRNMTLSSANIYRTDTVDQNYTNNNHSYNIGGRVSYTEPVGTGHYLEFSYSYSRSNTKSEKQTYDYNRATSAYDLLDSTYSSRYDNLYVNQQADIRFNTRREKYNYTLGIGIQPTSLTSTIWPQDEPFTQNVVNFSPTANFTYGVSRQNMLRFDYRGMTQQPTIQQLQPVADNSDPLYQVEGNPGLKPAFRHSMSVMYNNFNQGTLRTFLTSLSFNTTNNQIVNSSTYDQTGKQIVKPVNVNGVYGVNASVMMNLPIPKTKFSFNNTLGGNFNRGVNFSNGIENVTKSTSVNETFRLTYRNEWLELGSSYRLAYNRANYSLEDKATTDYFDHRVAGDLFLNLPWDVILSSDINYYFYRGYGDSYNRDMTLWNASLSKQIFKKKQGTIKLTVYDILKQNQSYIRTTTDNYVEDSYTNTMPQFFMLSFSYRFSSFGSNNQTNRRPDMPGGGFQGRPGGPGGPPPGGGFPGGGGPQGF